MEGDTLGGEVSVLWVVLYQRLVGERFRENIFLSYFVGEGLIPGRELADIYSIKIYSILGNHILRYQQPCPIHD